MGNIYGRQVVVPLTNKSGGSVIAGDVVVVDTSNNDAFTTSTAGAVTGTVGVAQETIASNAVGRILTGGYAALVNVNASVTRGNFGKTHTVAKQATDAGASRVAGTFCQFLTGGTTPDANVFNPDLGAGSGAPTTSTYITVTSDAGLSAEVPRPELDDQSPGTDVPISGAATGTGVTYAAQTNYAGLITYTNGSYQYCDVASAIGTGDFDLRCRIVEEVAISTPAGSASAILYLAATDSSRTQSTALVSQLSGPSNLNGAANALTRDGIGGTQVGNSLYGIRLPIILRVKRVGTSVTSYASSTNGAIWTPIGTARTSSLNVAKVGLWGHVNGLTDFGVLVHWVRTV